MVHIFLKGGGDVSGLGGGGCVGIVVTIQHGKSNTMFPGSLINQNTDGE